MLRLPDARLHRNPQVLPRLDWNQCGGFYGRDRVVVFDAYIDESGTDSKALIVLAAYVARVEKWADFSVEWNNVLREAGANYFHTKEFRNPHSKVFGHLSPDRKQTVLRSLIKLIGETVEFGCC